MAERSRLDAARARDPRGEHRPRIAQGHDVSTVRSTDPVPLEPLRVDPQLQARRTRSAPVSSPDLRSSDAARRAARAWLLAQYGRTCARCGDPIEAGETPHVGHVVSRSRGGTDAWSNLQLEHGLCNLRAGDRDDYSATNAAIDELERGINARNSGEDAIGAVFRTAKIPAGEAAPPGMVPNPGPPNRTSVRYRLIER